MAEIDDREIDDREIDDPPLPAHVTTPLLTLISNRSMDEDYAYVAQRRAAAGDTRAKPSKAHWTSVVVLGVLGLLAAIVTVQTNRESEVDQLSRAALIGQIDSRRDQLRTLQSQIGDLTRENQASISLTAQLDQQVGPLRATVSQLEVRTGFSAVQGPGVRIKVENQPGAEINSEIRDEDLAVLVDGLWSAGAEAIAINDQRINVLGGIRNTSRAIHVNGRPVNPPYIISVIGDNQTLQARLLQTSEGQEWFALVNALGFRYTPQNVDDIRLPAAPPPTLRSVIETNTGPDGLPQGEENDP